MTVEDEAKFLLTEGISLKKYIDRRVRKELKQTTLQNKGHYTVDGDWIPAGCEINCDGDVVKKGGSYW